MDTASCEVAFEAKGYSRGAPEPGDAAARPDKRVTLTISMGDPG